MELPAVDPLAAGTVRSGQHQVPGRVEDGQLELDVVLAGAVWVEQDLEVVVVVDHAFVLGQAAPDMRLLQLRAYVQAVVVPEHADPCSESPKRLEVTLDVHESLGPGSVPPDGLIESAVQRRRGATYPRGRSRRLLAPRFGCSSLNSMFIPSRNRMCAPCTVHLSRTGGRLHPAQSQAGEQGPKSPSGLPSPAHRHARRCSPSFVCFSSADRMP